MAAITVVSLLGYDATSLAHLYLGSFSHSSLQILSSSVRLDGGASLHTYCQVSPEMFDQVQVQALAGSLKDIQRLVPKPLPQHNAATTVHSLGMVSGFLQM